MLSFSPLPWEAELKYWLEKRGHSAKLVFSESLPIDDRRDDVRRERAMFRIDGIEYKFLIESETYGAAIVSVEGIPGVCHCNDQHCAFLLQEETVDERTGAIVQTEVQVSKRHPGLRWLYNDTLYDADERRHLLPANAQACFDRHGTRVIFTMAVHGAFVDTSDVLDHIYPKIRQVKIDTLRVNAMATRIQRAWLEVSYNPFTSVGARVMYQRGCDGQRWMS